MISFYFCFHMRFISTSSVLLLKLQRILGVLLQQLEAALVQTNYSNGLYEVDTILAMYCSGQSGGYYNNVTPSCLLSTS